MLRHQKDTSLTCPAVIFLFTKNAIASITGTLLGRNGAMPSAILQLGRQHLRRPHEEQPRTRDTSYPWAPRRLEWALRNRAWLSTVLTEPESSLCKTSTPSPNSGTVWNDAAYVESRLKEWWTWMFSLAIFYKHYFSCEFKYLLYHRHLQFVIRKVLLAFLLWKSITLMFIMVSLLHSNRRYFPKTWLLQAWDLMVQNLRNLKLKSWSEAPSEGGVISQTQSLSKL